ncbi:MAG: hypothetical protein E4H27_09355, partial [Anaerolineales bacterium]
AYLACDGGRWRAVVDGRPHGSYDTIGEGTLRFSPDGRHVAYAARTGDKWLAVVDGKELKKHAEFQGYEGIAEMVFSPDSRFLAYTAKLGTAELVLDLTTDDAEKQVKAHAATRLALLKEIPEWASYIP